jgi:hypothetical protein
MSCLQLAGMESPHHAESNQDNLFISSNDASVMCLSALSWQSSHEHALTCQDPIQVKGVQLLLLCLALSFCNGISIATAQATTAADVVTSLHTTPTQDLPNCAWGQAACAL